jgi:hypothetical protein
MGKPTLTADMIDALSICHTLDNAARSLALRESREWADWVRYFLLSLQQNANNGVYEDFLQTMQRDIAIRLNQGRW